MRLLVVLILIGGATFSSAQQWTKSEYRDELRNKTGIKFVLPAKEEGGGIGVVCTDGKLDMAWLMTDKIADSTEGTVEVLYRRDDEPKPHNLTLPVSRSFHGVLLQRHHGFADPGGGIKASVGFEELLYGPIGFGGGEWRKNKKANHWAHKLIVGLPEFLGLEVVYTFEVPDPTPIREECGIH